MFLHHLKKIEFLKTKFHKRFNVKNGNFQKDDHFFRTIIGEKKFINFLTWGLQFFYFKDRIFKLIE